MQIRVHCNSTQPCLQWDGVVCRKLAVCSAMECSKEDLSFHHLSIEDTERNNYIHGDKIRIGCDEGYEFENGEDIIDIQCIKGKWHSKSNEKIPKCSKYFYCIFRPPKGLIFYVRSHPDGSMMIKHNARIGYVLIRSN